MGRMVWPARGGLPAHAPRGVGRKVGQSPPTRLQRKRPAARRFGRPFGSRPVGRRRMNARAREEEAQEEALRRRPTQFWGRFGRSWMSSRAAAGPLFWFRVLLCEMSRHASFSRARPAAPFMLTVAVVCAAAEALETCAPVEHRVSAIQIYEDAQKPRFLRPNYVPSLLSGA